MKDKFYIDRQFGQAIWIEVEEGIVLRCWGETEKYNAKLEENYKGKSITFLQTDFIGRAMVGTYHHLRCESIIVAMKVVADLESKVHNVNSYIRELNKVNTRDEFKTKLKKEKLEEYRKILEKQQIELYDARELLEIEKERILTVHKFTQ